MAKYSTGDSGGGSGETCELCGAAGDLETAEVAGARLQVCDDCLEHGDQAASGDDGDRDRKKRTARNAAKVYDAASGDSSHWEDGADYDDDQLPYLVTGYDERLTEARQEAGLQLDELAAELDLEEADLLALEQGRATQAGVGGSTVAALESFLGVELVEE